MPKQKKKGSYKRDSFEKGKRISSIKMKNFKKHLDYENRREIQDSVLDLYYQYILEDKKMDYSANQQDFENYENDYDHEYNDYLVEMNDDDVEYMELEEYLKTLWD